MTADDFDVDVDEFGFPEFRRFYHGEHDVVDYLFEWRSEGHPFLTPNDFITDSVWRVTDTRWKPTKDIDVVRQEFSESTATVWLSRPKPNRVLLATNHIKTDQGREKDDTVLIIAVRSPAPWL